MNLVFRKSRKTSKSSEFSVFVREARSRHKKKVFKRVLNEAIDAQDRMIKSAGVRPMKEKN